MTRRFPLFLFTLALYWLAASCMNVARAADKPALPDPKLTPGARDLRITQANIKTTVCKSGYTKTVRNVPESEKKEVMLRYGLPEFELKKVEIDHLISLELAGSNDITNLWPQYYLPKPGAREKDTLETYLKRAVCRGDITISEAQSEISTDWYAAYQKYGLGK